MLSGGLLHIAVRPARTPFATGIEDQNLEADHDQVQRASHPPGHDLGPVECSCRSHRAGSRRETAIALHPLKRLDRMLTTARMRHDLRDLDDRMLKDIGVSRLDIEREVRRPFWDVDDERLN